MEMMGCAELIKPIVTRFDDYPAVQLADQATDQAQRSITTFHVE